MVIADHLLLIVHLCDSNLSLYTSATVVIYCVPDCTIFGCLKFVLTATDGYALCVHARLLSHVWICDPVDYSLPDSSVRGILQARILEWVTIPLSRGSSWSRDQTLVSHTLAGGFLATEPLMDTCFLLFLLPFIVRSLLSPNPWDTGEPRLRVLSSCYEPGLPKTRRHGCHLWASQICKIPSFTFSVLLLALVLGYSKSNMIIDADSQGKQTPAFCTLLPCPILGLAHILGRN